ncbi:MAG: 50S ribosomal protein L25 [Verrucomicrobiota bacterium]|nr:50S ribosomal protein L25 [Verrucomicrobiota bacterium]
MAKQAKLTAEPRTAIGRSAVRKLKAAGSVPAVIYGAKDKPETLQVSRRDINALLSHAAGENILVELDVAGKSRLALVQEVQHAPLGGAVLHIDFHAVSMDEVIEADVPLAPIGIANGVKNMGGLLEQSLRSLAIECLPRDLPDVITVDVSALDIGDGIHVREIQLPAGVTTRVQPDLTVFSVLAPTVEEEPVAATAEAPTGPEVIREKKEEPEGAAGGSPKDKDKDQKK